MNDHELADCLADLLTAWPYPAMSERQHEMWATTLRFHDRRDFRSALERHFNQRQRPSPKEFAELLQSLGLARRQREDQARREASLRANEAEWADGFESRAERASRHIAAMRAQLAAKGVQSQHQPTKEHA